MLHAILFTILVSVTDDPTGLKRRREECGRE
jgi:hypothetical protein